MYAGPEYMLCAVPHRSAKTTVSMKDVSVKVTACEAGRGEGRAEAEQGQEREQAQVT